MTSAALPNPAPNWRQPLSATARRVAKAAAFVAFLAPGLGPAAQAAPGIRLEDDRGTTVELQGPARRIVSLMPSLTETVCALDACDRLVGIDRHANWPASVKGLPQVGGIDDANIERIVALKPDLVLLRPRSRAAEPLERLGLKVLALDAKTHADMRRVMETVARATGRPGAGEAFWRKLDAGLDAARARVPAGWQGRRVYFEVHGGMAAASESSFIGETLARLGLGNAVPGTLGPFPKMSPEFVVRANPDVLMVSALGEISAMAGRPGWSAMSAIQRGRVCSFASARFDLMMRPGPRLDEAADAIVACLASLGDGKP
ncbi:iron complex transport system substrate-binding protein [Variovorax sp. OK605]|uniref:ABC transporter substrate-binding protein n=1 Tax=Variovorax sp. OK605 TaxID=1855317 RepID=UPI0008E3E6F5|nr:helical backbone metal receptor [Variovorax sp. OK605]SFQ39636.1 iron complex transport system substrate-binding protein [Variovorax sp. OK605]